MRGVAIVGRVRVVPVRQPSIIGFRPRRRARPRAPRWSFPRPARAPTAPAVPPEATSPCTVRVAAPDERFGSGQGPDSPRGSGWGTMRSAFSCTANVAMNPVRWAALRKPRCTRHTSRPSRPGRFSALSSGDGTVRATSGAGPRGGATARAQKRRRRRTGRAPRGPAPRGCSLLRVGTARRRYPGRADCRYQLTQHRRRPGRFGGRPDARGGFPHIARRADRDHAL